MGFWTDEKPMTALIAAGGNVVSQWLSYEQNKKLMEKNQQWQEKMSNTAHQREMADLKAAGLNPILTTDYGGASYGAVSNPTISDSKLGEVFAQIHMQNKINNANIQKADAETKFIDRSTDKLDTDIELNKWEALSKRSQIQLNNALTNYHQLSAMLAEGRNSREEREFLYKLKNLQADTVFKFSQAKNLNAQVDVMDTQKLVNMAQAKYTNERARGFTLSGHGSLGVELGKKKWNIGKGSLSGGFTKTW